MNLGKSKVIKFTREEIDGRMRVKLNGEVSEKNKEFQVSRIEISNIWRSRIGCE